MYKITVNEPAPCSWASFSYCPKQPFLANLRKLQANSKFRTFYVLSNYLETLLPDSLIDFFHHTSLIRETFHLIKIAISLN